MAEKETSVLVGVCDTACPEPRLSPYENKIGGYPDLLPGCSLSAPPRCAVCGCDLVLLVQVYCPLEGSPYHRSLHVFCCTQQQCWSKPESWLVLRSQAMDHSNDHQAQQEVCNGGNQQITTNGAFSLEEWCTSATDWGSTVKNVTESLHHREGDDGDTTLRDTVTSSLQQQAPPPDHVTPLVDHITSSMKHLTLPAYHGPCYHSFYINVFEEHSLYHNGGDLDHAYELLEQYNSNTTNHAAAVGSGGEVYEKAGAGHGDTTFHKFQKQLSKCPRQVIRYDRRGDPLSISSSHHPLSAVCSQCGSRCVFELQIMPPLIYLLQQAESQAHSKPSSPVPNVVEFGTVLVYCCERSCWDGSSAGDNSTSSSGWRQEVIVIQQDTETAQLTHLTRSH